MPLPPKPSPGQGRAAKPQTVPPKPTRELAAPPRPPGRSSTAAASSVFGLWSSPGSGLAWTTFTAAIVGHDPDDRAIHVPQRPRRAAQHHQDRPPLHLRARGSQRAVQDRVGLLGRPLDAVQRPGYPYALQSVCTHLGCPPNWLAGEQKFKCPCHGSGFYISGINFEGPAPRPLERFKVALADDGQIMVDKSQKFQQELGQWSDPDSFITA